MTGHTVSTYDKELNLLKESLLKMGKLVLEIVEMSRQALEHTEIDFTQRATDFDKEINGLNVAIEKHATGLLALRQPMAIDLRFVTTSIKMATIFERMGDIAKNNAKRAHRVEESHIEPGLFSPEVSNEMNFIALFVEKMISDVLLAIEKQDENEAIAVFKRDEQVDMHYYQLFQQLSKEMTQDAQKVEAGVQILFAAKNFERLGDYATNLAKAVYYIVSGKRLRLADIVSSQTV